MEQLPAISGKQLMKLLMKDGWQAGRHATHGRTLSKRFGSRTRVTFIPDKSKALPQGTLSAILGHKQTQLGRKGLSELIEKHGLP